MTPDEFLSRAVKFDLAVDGGAYAGSWTVPMSERFKRVIAFELCTEQYQELVLRTQTVLHCVTPLNIALGAEKRMVGYVGDKSPDSPVKCVTAGDKVRMLPLDSLELPALDFLKLDLQGYEYFALIGAKETINKHRPLIHLEVDPPSQDTFDVRDKSQELLRGWGYAEIVKNGDEALYAPG